MPELPVKETRMPELHLPEISRKDIMRSLSEMRMPEVEMPKVDLSDVDLGKAVAGVAAAAHIGRRSRAALAVRGRWPDRRRRGDGGHPLATRRSAPRSPVASTPCASASTRCARRATTSSTSIGTTPSPSMPPTTAPIADVTPYSEGSALDTTADYPAGLGSNGHEDGIPAFEESTSRS